MEIKIVLDLPRDAVSVPVSRQVLDSCLETLGVRPDTRADIALALSEACANVIQHAGPGEDYEVQVSAKNCRCVIEVVNTGSRDSEPVSDGSSTATLEDDRRLGEEQPDWFPLPDHPVSATAEHGRGLKIIDAVADNLQLTGNHRRGTTVHFEKTLEWLPGAAGQHLFSADGVVLTPTPPSAGTLRAWPGPVPGRGRDPRHEGPPPDAQGMPPWRPGGADTARTAPRCG